MRFLFVVTWLHAQGGDSRHAFSVAEGLEELGHEVVFFGMEDTPNPAGLPGPLAPRIDFRELLASHSTLTRLKALRSIYSLPARDAAVEFMRRHGPFDLVHIHSVHHQLSMSVVDVLENYGVPIVWTLHDFKMVCPNTTLLRERSGERCPAPGRGAPICVALHRCKKASRPSSIIAAAESLLTAVGAYYEKADMFIAPSAFLKTLVEEVGVTTRPIRVLPNFSPIPPDLDPEPPGTDILYVGRIEKPKGLSILIRAFSSVSDRIEGRLIVVGGGHDEEYLKGLAGKLLPPERYAFTGMIDSPLEIAALNRRSGFMVLPSLWYENLPLSILESFSCARPVVASRTGGVPELVQEGVTGYLVEPGSEEELAEALIRMSTDRTRMRDMGLAGLERVRAQYMRADYLEELMKVYLEVLGD